MSGDIIKSFLVGLGFDVDDASLAKFNKAIASATVKVTALYASTKLAAAGIVYGISKISESFEQLGYEYRLIVPTINKALVLRQELLKAYSAAGINITKVVQQSVKLNFSLAKTKFALEAIYKSVGSRFFELLTKQSDIFRQKLYANMPKIQAALERMVKFIFKAFEATVELGNRVFSILSHVYDFFVALDKATDGWSTKILAFIAVWQALNLSFLATPLGMLITGLVAILALFDDFEVWREGGESLFDWSSFVPVIDSVTAALQSLNGVLKSIFEVLGLVGLAIYQAFSGDFSGVIDSLKEAGNAMLNVFSGLWETVKGLVNSLVPISNFAASVSGGIGNFLSGAFSNLSNTPAGGVAASPAVSSHVQNHANSNQNVNQQTSITVMGSADANATGKAIASQQSKVNFDMVRNLKGATR